jgi:hypothetical protein
MNIRPFSPADRGRLCVIHDAAWLHELEAAGLADAFQTLRRTDGRFTGNEAHAASRYPLQCTASVAEPP